MPYAWARYLGKDGIPCTSNPMETTHPMVNPGCQRQRLGPWMAWEPRCNPCQHVPRTYPSATGTNPFVK